MSQYKTRRQQQRSRRSNKIKGTILIVVLLALTGVTGYYYMKYKNGEFTFLNSSSPKLDAQLKETQKDSPQILAENYTKAEERLKDKPSDALKETEPLEEEVNSPKNSLKDSVKNNKAIKEVMPATKTVVDSSSTPLSAATGLMQLSEEQMTEIWNNIQAEKNKNNSRSNCIQIQKTTTSNVENAFAIAKFLKDKGFIISGRLIVGGNHSGVQIDAAGSCVKVTIGNL